MKVATMSIGCCSSRSRITRSALSSCLNMQFVINLGCLKYRLTPEEVLPAVTLNGAAAIDMADKVGTVEAGKLGDLVIWDAPDLDYICYRFGSNLAKKVIKRGRVM